MVFVTFPLGILSILICISQDALTYQVEKCCEITIIIQLLFSSVLISLLGPIRAVKANHKMLPWGVNGPLKIT